MFPTLSVCSGPMCLCFNLPDEACLIDLSPTMLVKIVTFG